MDNLNQDHNQSMPPSSPTPQKSTNILLIILITVVSTSILTGGVIYFFQDKKIDNVKKELESQIEKSSQESQKSKIPSAKTKTDVSEPVTKTNSQPTSNPATDSVETGESEPYAGWSTYINDRFNYKIKYPQSIQNQPVVISEATKAMFNNSGDVIGDASNLTAEERYAKFTGKICMNFSYGPKIGSISIAAPENQNKVAMCAYIGGPDFKRQENFQENITIAGKTYTAKVFRLYGHDDKAFFEQVKFSLADGTQIYLTSGTDINSYQQWPQIKAEFIKILESYEKIS
ncbi:MAG: hypothetical protein GF335_00160 [Candidatus Moranbacteria bacterium]|nr:hypothetical protein [Candidatus Moranbacteria bacterium]